MEHWVPIRTCEYHEEQRTPCETCFNDNEDFLTEVLYAIDKERP